MVTVSPELQDLPNAPPTVPYVSTGTPEPLEHKRKPTPPGCAPLGVSGSPSGTAQVLSSIAQEPLLLSHIQGWLALVIGNP